MESPDEMESVDLTDLLILVHHVSAMQTRLIDRYENPSYSFRPGIVREFDLGFRRGTCTRM